MPGAFSRAPYPQTTVFDPCGLYRDSLASRGASDIIASQPTSALVSSFKTEVRRIFRTFPYKDRSTLISGRKIDRLALLPLQISDHYAFKAETQFSSQAELCSSAMKAMGQGTGLFVTEYVSKLYKDQVMTPDFVAFLQRQTPNLIFDPATSELPSVSQHILQSVDEVVTATSGLCFQAMAWGLPVSIIGETHLLPFDKKFVNTDEKRDRVLSFLLTRQQPLNRSIVSDGKFLSHLLEEVKSRRQRPLLERMPDFESLDREYATKVMQSFRSQETERTFINLGKIKRPPSKAVEFRELLRSAKPKVISFDLFDTLVARGFEQPADLYAYLELDLRASAHGAPFNFAEKRLSAEIMARKKATKEEVTLDDIYREFATSEGLSFEEVLAFRDRELEVEILSCCPRPLGRDLYAVAKERNATICITSDMYLPRTAIDAILRNNGYRDIDKVYLSSEVGLTKKSGGLFGHIASHSGVETSEIVHVGDNERTDVRPAKAAGVTPLHVPRPIEKLWKHQAFSACFPKRTPISSLGRSLTTAAIARTLFDDLMPTDDSISGGDPWKLGYAAVGPLVYGFISWLRTSAVEHNITALHFLSREGKIFKDVFDRMEQTSPTGIRTNYLWGSRRAIRVAQMKSLTDIIELGNQTIDRSATVGTLLTNRFGLDVSKIPMNKIKDSGYKSINDEVTNSLEGKVKLAELLTSLKAEILSVSMAEGEAYSDYLASLGLFTEENVAVVDVGWNANMQGSLGQILGRPISGYYLATLFAANRWKAAGHKIHGYHQESATVTTNDAILSNRIILENLLCDITPTILGVTGNSHSGYRAKYAGITPPQRMQLIRSVHDGAKAFADDLCRTLGAQVGAVEVRPDISLAVMQSFLSNPAPADAKLLAGHELEDSFSGAQARYLLAPFKNGRPTSSSYWQQGELSLLGRSIQPGINTAGLNPKKLSPREKLLMPFVRPFVRKLGDARDVMEFNVNPSLFFQKLRDRRYRRIGEILFPPG
ncbi:hypothetical protein D3C80_740240 [compost metagenome]